MRYRGLTTVVVLTFGLVAMLTASAIAQTTQPAKPEQSEWVPVQVDPAGAAAPAPNTASTAGDPNAKPGDPNAKGSDESTDGGSDNSMMMLLFLAGALVLMMIWSSRSKRKQQAQKRDMLNNLKKGDKITTIGGIIGTVIEARPEEITVKVDETNNVRMKFTRGAIHGVGSSAKSARDEDKK